ncbi:tetratricopeptide repeat protein [Bdellovibrio sp. HCB2-146]|uniref:tetratricopeptide repeat protein n=1 Tax=Bdellovibrio sp. HCB2-146 TaxID=3394362 RepID=UPI0039BD9175
MLSAWMRAAVVAALSFSSPLLLAQSKPAKSETYKDIIEKAYNLSLQKDRQQALNILANAIKKESRTPAVSELKKAVNDIGHVFFSDKAQQLYETSVSMRKSDPTQALAKMNEALRIEPDNFDILNETARLMIAKGDCAGAAELVQKELKVINFDEELNLTLAQAYACQSKWTEYQMLFEIHGPKKSSLAKYWYPLEIERFLSLKNTVKAQESLASLRKLDPKYPEAPYWQWRIDQALQKKNRDEALKYVMSCKNISANQYRQYMMDPALCRRVTEFDGELKGMNGSAE